MLLTAPARIIMAVTRYAWSVAMLRLVALEFLEDTLIVDVRVAWNGDKETSYTSGDFALLFIIRTILRDDIVSEY